MWDTLKNHPVGLMAPWVYDEKFPVGTQFLFGTLMFQLACHLLRLL
jgi:hypothetical protein